MLIVKSEKLEYTKVININMQEKNGTPDDAIFKK
jgi:hypothetical protein